MKRLSTLPLIFLLTLNAFAQDAEKKLALYNKSRGLEKVFLHTDRTLYEPSSTIWFSAFVQSDGKNDTTVSRLLFVELLNPKGEVVQHKRYLINNGRSYGEFAIYGAVGGIYKLKAYTNYMANFGDSFFFSKDITVHEVFYPQLLLGLDLNKKSYAPGDSVKATINAKNLDNHYLVKNKIRIELLYDGQVVLSQDVITDLKGNAAASLKLPANLPELDASIRIKANFQGVTEVLSKPVQMPLKGILISFMPEGGYVLRDAMNRIAFKALNKNGKAADVKGDILNEKGELISRFESKHMGMGSLELAGNSECHYARITSPYVSQELIELPAAQVKGFALQLLPASDGYRLLLHKRNIGNKHGSLLIRFRNEILAKIPLYWNGDSLELNIERSRLMHGIHSVILLSGDEAVCERLFFHDRNSYQLSITTNKSVYAAKEKVDLKISLKDSSGKALKGSFSLSVLDARSANLIDDKQDVISSYLLVSSELRGKIEEPSFYFTRNNDPDHSKLDLLMLTQGWRRYSWEKILASDSAQLAAPLPYDREKLLISGYIYDDRWKPMRHSKIRLLGKSKFVYSDSSGRFVINADTITLPLVLSIRKHGLINDWLVKEAQINSKRCYAIEQKRVQTIKPAYNNYRRGEARHRIKSLENSYASSSTIERRIILKAPSRNINTLSGTTYTAYSVNGGTPTFTGSRVDGTRYFIDGVPMIGTLDLNLHPSYSYMPYRAYSYQDYEYLHFKLDKGTEISSPLTFYAPAYANVTYISSGTDKRILLHWAPVLEVKKGEAELSFYSNDEATTFICELQGITEDGTPLTAYYYFTSSPAFAMKADFPKYMLVKDSLKLKVQFDNKSDHAVRGSLYVEAGGTYQRFFDSVTVPAQSRIFVHIPVEATRSGNYFWQLNFYSNQDAVHLYSPLIQNIESRFHRQVHYSGSVLEDSFQFQISDAIPGSIRGNFRVEGGLMAQLTRSAEKMIQEPHGCFEQVSSSNYPNIALIRLLEKAGADMDRIDAYKDILRSGYNKLKAYETRQGGFEWYGNTPPNEGLTAYGLLQFHKMKRWIHIDRDLVQRTLKWLKKRRNSDGSYMVNQGKYGFAGAGTKVTTAYVTWVLSETGEYVPPESVERMESWLKNKPDDYLRALLANIYVKEGRLYEARMLISAAAADCQGNWNKLKAEQTITYSYGISMQVECLSLMILAGIKSGYGDKNLKTMIQYLQTMRSNNYYGTTQATVLAYEALTEYYFTHISEGPKSGLLTVSLNDFSKDIYFNSDEYFSHHLTFVEKNFQNKNTFALYFNDEDIHLPFTFEAEWYSDYPQNSSEKRMVELSCVYNTDSVELGAVVRLNVNLQNKHKNGQPQTVAIIGIPAGLTLDIQQLKLMQDNNLFSYYEQNQEYLVLYWTELAPEANISLAFDLEAKISGVFHSPPSIAYLYYTPESKFWCKANPVSVGP